MLQKGGTINSRKVILKGGKIKEGQIAKANHCLRDTFKFHCQSKATTSSLKGSVVSEVDQLTGIRKKALTIKFARLSYTIKPLR